MKMMKKKMKKGGISRDPYANYIYSSKDMQCVSYIHQAKVKKKEEENRVCLIN